MYILIDLFLAAINIYAYIYCGEHWFNIAAAGYVLGLATSMIIDKLLSR